MDQRELEAFVVVAEELHFGRAADRLHQSASPLSQTIRKLEKELDVRLFERTTRTVTLTASGRAFLPHARAILNQMEDSRAAARQAVPGTYGSVTLAFAGAVNHRTLPILAQAVRHRYPDIKLHLAGGYMTVGALQQLRRGAADIAFVGLPVNEDGITVMTVMEEPLGVVMPQGHRLLTAHPDVIPLRALRDEAFIMARWDSGSSVRDATLQACQQAGFRPRVVQEANDTQVVLALCAAGVGVALLPSAMSELLPYGVDYRPIEEVILLGSALAWAPDRLSPAARTVTELAKELFDEDYVEMRHTEREI
ncbi:MULTISPECIES: LysR substrate-binding domain-containing protein [unclassified Luteococcus]|uniref:LysR substrate-binding domain-containing protein n=1 Tax=unclassified Luteococcus TaxID=2639923 RepID=UPI00313A78C6